MTVNYYTGRWTTGVLGVALAADAPIAGLRMATTSTKTGYVTRIDLGFAEVAAFTAAQQFGLYMERYRAADLGGGTVETPLRMTSPVAPSSQSSDLRHSAAAALTSAGVTFEGNKVPLLSWASAVAGFQVDPVTVFDASRDGAPIRLPAGYGLALRNLIVWPAAGTGVVHGRITWYEPDV